MRKGWKDLRENAHLDVVGDPQLAFDPLLRRGRFRELLGRSGEPFGHLVERTGELADLVARRNLNPMRQVSLGDMRRGGEWRLNRYGRLRHISGVAAGAGEVADRR